MRYRRLGRAWVRRVGYEWGKGQRRTVYAVDTNDIFEDRGPLVGGLPVQQGTISLDASEGDDGGDGDFESEDVDQLVDGLGEDLVCAEGNPGREVNTSASEREWPSG